MSDETMFDLTGQVTAEQQAEQAKQEYDQKVEQTQWQQKPAQYAPAEPQQYQASVQAPAANDGWDDNLEGMMFSNPKAFYQKLREDTRKEVVQEFRKREREDQFWDDFYNTNPELKKSKKLVDMVVKDKNEDIVNLVNNGQLAEVKKLLASETRDIINSVKTDVGVRTELPAVRAEVLGASQTQMPKAPVEEAPVSFIDQVKKMQRRGR